MVPSSLLPCVGIFMLIILAFTQSVQVRNEGENVGLYPVEPLKHADNLIRSQNNARKILETQHGRGRSNIESVEHEMLQDIADSQNPEIYMNVKQLIMSRGYPYEEHEIQTTDGYLLTVQRIPNTISESRINVVYLQHGLLCSAADFVMDDKNKSLAFILHDAGYDVWLGNMRGNVYSRKHIQYQPANNDFWDWSWEEMAKYDLPAMVDKILRITSKPQLYYVGHSQGTLVGFSGFSENYDLASKIKMFFALAPVAYLGQVKSPIRLMAPMSGSIDLLLDMLGLNEFLPNTAITKWFSSAVCGQDVFQVACSNSMFLLVGFNPKNLDTKRVSVYAAHDPAGTSSKNFIHFAQLISSNRLQKFDYGLFKNLVKYRTMSPPEYDLTQFTVPTVLFWGVEDWLAAPEGVEKLIPKLKTMRGSIKYETYNHIDFLWGLDAPSTLYNKILIYMNTQQG